MQERVIMSRLNNSCCSNNRGSSSDTISNCSFKSHKQRTKLVNYSFYARFGRQINSSLYRYRSSYRCDKYMKSISITDSLNEFNVNPPPLFRRRTHRKSHIVQCNRNDYNLRNHYSIRTHHKQRELNLRNYPLYRCPRRVVICKSSEDQSHNDNQQKLSVVERTIDKIINGSQIKKDNDNSRRTFIVPWSLRIVAIGLTAWAVSFILVSFVSVTLFLVPNDASDGSLKTVLSTDFVLKEQILQVFIGIGVIALSIREYWKVLPEYGLFTVDLKILNVEKGKGPFNKEDGWLLYALIYYLIGFVAVAMLGLLLHEAGWFSAQENGRGTVDEIAGLMTSKPSDLLSLLLVTSFGAPLLEEVVFRGFLLTSINSFINLESSSDTQREGQLRLREDDAAIILSSLLFAASHLSVRDFPQVMGLGVVLGYAYRRTRNLLTPITIHALWNGAVIIVLFVAVTTGVNIEELIKQR